MAAQAPSGLGRRLLTRDHLLTRCAERRRPTLASSPPEFGRSACLEPGPRSIKVAKPPGHSPQARCDAHARPLAPRYQRPYKANSPAL